MQEQELLAQVTEAIRGTLKTEGKPITLEARLTGRTSAGDSLDMLELIMALEEKFGIEVPDEDSEQIHTVRDVVEYVKKRVQEDK